MPATCREILAAVDDNTNGLLVLIAGVVVTDGVRDAATSTTSWRRPRHMVATSSSRRFFREESQPGSLVDPSSMDDGD